MIKAIAINLVAHLQASHQGTNPILMGSDENVGHRYHTNLDERARRWGERVAFLIDHLGLWDTDKA